MWTSGYEIRGGSKNWPMTSFSQWIFHQVILLSVPGTFDHDRRWLDQLEGLTWIIPRHMMISAPFPSSLIQELSSVPWLNHEDHLFSRFTFRLRCLRHFCKPYLSLLFFLPSVLLPFYPVPHQLKLLTVAMSGGGFRYGVFCGPQPIKEGMCFGPYTGSIVCLDELSSSSFQSESLWEVGETSCARAYVCIQITFLCEWKITVYLTSLLVYGPVRT